MILYAFSLSKKFSEKNYFVFSCVISYVLLSITSLLKSKFLVSVPDNAIINSAIAIVIGTIIVTFFVVLSQRKWVKKITVKILHKTLNDDIWRDIFDLENGSNLKIYLKNKNYYLIGHLKSYEENCSDPWIALNAFAKFDEKKNCNYKNEPSFLENDEAIIIVRFSDIDHIEVF